MNDDQFKRARQAVKESMTIEHVEDAQYRVKDEYDVDLLKKTCSCPDHEYRNHLCKHLQRVNMEVFAEALPGPETDDTGTVSRPNPLVPIYENIPRLLREMDHWVCWVNQRDDKESHEKDWTKVPLSVHGGFASSTDESTWATFAAAKKMDETTKERTDGVGFCVSKDDAVIGIDIDDCRDPDTGELVEGIDDIVEHVGSYMEVSPSGTGLRVFVLGEWPDGVANQTDAIAGRGTSLEVYYWGRYLTVTGYHVDGTPDDVVADQDTIDFFAEIMSPGYKRDSEEADA